MKLKNMSRIFLLALCLICSLSGCSSENEEIKAIIERGVLRVGVKVDVPRFGDLNPVTNENEGMEIDLARAIAKDILGDENAVKYSGITAQTRGPLLDNGEIDIVIATFTITEERKTLFNFTRPYYTDEIGYLVLDNSQIQSPDGLNGKSIGVATASTAKTALEDECVRLGIDINIMEYNSYPEIKAALNNGIIEAFVADKSILYGYLDESCILLKDGFNPQQYGIACKLENNKLAEHIDSLLEQLEIDGELNKIREKWGLN